MFGVTRQRTKLMYFYLAGKTSKNMNFAPRSDEAELRFLFGGALNRSKQTHTMSCGAEYGTTINF